jgi:hypothetical protein
METFIVWYFVGLFVFAVFITYLKARTDAAEHKKNFNSSELGPSDPIPDEIERLNNGWPL